MHFLYKMNDKLSLRNSFADVRRCVVKLTAFVRVKNEMFYRTL
jgi:hypothetical protein